MAAPVVARATVEFRVFRKNFAYLKDGLKEELDALTPLLYQHDFITPECRDKVLLRMRDKNQRTLDLLVAVESQVKTNPTAFSTFMRVLTSLPPLMHLAEKLQGDCDHMLNPPLGSYRTETPTYPPLDSYRTETPTDPPLDSYHTETPTDPAGQLLHAPLEAESDPTDQPLASRHGAVAGPPPPSTMRPSDSVPPNLTLPEPKPSALVQFFLSPSPETSQNSSSSIVGAPQPLPIVDDLQCMRSPRHSMSVPGSDAARLACITQPEFRRELTSKLHNLEEFVVASYSEKELEVEEQSAEVAQTKFQVQKTSKELVQLADQLEAAEQRCEGYEAEISGYQEELKQAESQHMKEKARLESQLSSKMADHEGMASAVRQLAKRCEELELAQETERVEHSRTLEDSKQEIQDLGEVVVSLRSENHSLHEEKTSLCAELEQRKVEISSLRQELENVNSGFSKKQAEIQKKIWKTKSVSRSRINSAAQQCLDIKVQMKQSVSQLDVFTESQDPELKKLIRDIQRLFRVYDKQKRSVSWPSGLCKLQLL